MLGTLENKNFTRIISVKIMAHSTVMDTTSRDHFTTFSFYSSKGNDVFAHFISYIVPKEIPMEYTFLDGCSIDLKCHYGHYS